MHRFAVFLSIATCAFVSPRGSSAKEPPKTWLAGVAKIKITPEKAMWMSGYASRKKPAEGTLHDLWAKALVLEDLGGRRGVIVTLDLVGIPRDLSLEICAALKKQYKLPRNAIVLATSHTHTGPVVGSNLNAMYFLSDEQQKLVEDYAETLTNKIVQVVGEAIKTSEYARLEWGNGKAAFAVNRRNNKEADVPKIREQGMLKGPVDHQAPVLAVYDYARKSKLRAVVFGYACHATVLSFYQWSGDYPGFAQIELEKAYPGCIAMFWAGCGADQNPLPRRTVSLARKYGNELAGAVKVVLDGKKRTLKPNLSATYKEIDLPFAPLPTRDALVNDSSSTNRYVAARANLLLKKMKNDGALKGTYPYPVQTWVLGDEIKWITLGGEVVVDYALRFKKELGADKTWVMGYANDVMAYIPSVRVLKEGGYEGGGAMVYYGLPTVWSPKVEELIVAEAQRQLKGRIK